MTSFALYALSYYWNNTAYIFVAYAIVSIRNAIRMCDFEDTRSYMSSTEFVNRLALQSMITEMFLLIYIAYFANVKGHMLNSIIYCIICCFSYYQGFAGYNNTYCHQCDKVNFYQVPLFA